MNGFYQRVKLTRCHFERFEKRALDFEFVKKGNHTFSNRSK
jgi:hypothetical protein